MRELLAYIFLYLFLIYISTERSWAHSQLVPEFFLCISLFTPFAFILTFHWNLEVLCCHKVSENENCEIVEYIFCQECKKKKKYRIIALAVNWLLVDFWRGRISICGQALAWGWSRRRGQSRKLLLCSTWLYSISRQKWQLAIVEPSWSLESRMDYKKRGTSS